MNKEIVAKIEGEFFIEIITPIEEHLKVGKMTLQEEFMAKQKTFPKLQKLLKEFSLQNNVSIQQIILKIQDMIENREGQSKESCERQHRLVNEMLEGILENENKQEKMH